MPTSDIAAFREVLRNAGHVTVLTGAGVSAESGLATFRGPGGLWRKYDMGDLSTRWAWGNNPGLVWEFYNHRRRVLQDKKPNAGHVVLAELEQKLTDAGRGFHLITMNIDDLHVDAGTKSLTRIHGSIWLRCGDCWTVSDNRDVPITPAFEGNDGPDPDEGGACTDDQLPRCDRSPCEGFLRPAVTWFGEMLDESNLNIAYDAVEKSDLYITVGSSNNVYPVAGFAGDARSHGAKVAEVNLEPTGLTDSCDFVFHGKAGELLPQLLDVTF